MRNDSDSDNDRPEPPDGALIARCIAGDEEAFDLLYNRYRLPLFAYLHKLLPGNPAQAEDVFQQVWARAIRHWERYDDRQKLLAWLCRIAHNLVMDMHRRNRLFSPEALDDRDAPAPQQTTLDTVAEAELHAALEHAIAQLPEEQRIVIEYRRNGRSFKEIADEFNTSINTVLGRMHYAVLKLRKQLKEYL